MRLQNTELRWLLFSMSSQNKRNPFWRMWILKMWTRVQVIVTYNITQLFCFFILNVFEIFRRNRTWEYGEAITRDCLPHYSTQQ
jgi:hypothetical protein